MTILLNNQSCFSICESSLRIKSIVDFAKNHGMKSIGLCDNNSLFGAMSFYNECKQAGINPIIGIKAEVEIEGNHFKYLFFAKNNTGYKELIGLSSYLNCENNFLSFEQMNQVSENIIVINDNELSYPYCLISENDFSRLDSYINYIISKPNFYIGIGSNYSGFNRDKNIVLNQRLLSHKNKKVALECARFACEEDYDATKVLLAIKSGTTFKDEKLYLNPESYLKTSEEMLDIFDIDSLENTEIIASQINLDLSKFTTYLPEFEKSGITDNKKYLHDLAFAGLSKRLNGKVSKTYSNRLEYELSIISKMNFDNYFLIIFDLIREAKKQGIYIGPGRGSCVGSLVAYCLGITHLDPLKYNLLFERFLNPERITMPDIDIDIPDNKRQQVIDYVREKYGENHIAHIITFGTLQTKAAIRDVGKVLSIRSDVMDIISKCLSNTEGSLEEIYQNNRRFREAIESSKATTDLYRIALKLQSIPRNISTHASGVVMSKCPLNDIVPVVSVNGYYSTQYEAGYLEAMGLIKMDFLGVRNLTTIDEIVKSIDPSMDILKISLEDKNTYSLLCRGDTNGVFQLERNGMKRTLMAIKPTCFDDITTCISLYRPGPMENIPLYLANKANPGKIEFVDDSLKDILQPTYGIIIYQEQIMQLAQRVAKFSLGKADILRRAIAKKKVEEMDKMKSEFISGAVNNGYSLNSAEKIFEDIYRFAAYGFNKSHGCGYALIAYQLAYLKANYPLHFYVALLNANIGDSVKTNEFVSEARKKAVRILSVDICHSKSEFTIENNCIRFPLSAIKHVSNACANSIVQDIENNGEYRSYVDFISRATLLGLSDKVIEALIRSGALDCFEMNHNTLLENKKAILDYIKLCRISKDGEVKYDFSIVSEPILIRVADSKSEVLQDQLDYLGLYLNGHPVMQYRQSNPNCMEIYRVSQQYGDVRFLGMINSVKEVTTRKSKEKMCFMTLSDETGEIECAVMPKSYTSYANIVRKGAMMIVEGRNDGKDSIVVKNLIPLKG